MTHAMVKGSNIQVHSSTVRAALRWSPGPGAPDIDVSALLLGPDGRVRSDQDFVFYNQPRHPSGAVRHRPKQRGPQGITDPVEVDLGTLDASVECVVIAASVDAGTFTDLNLSITIHDISPGADSSPIAEYTVVPETGRESALNCGELYRRGDGWKFRAIGQGYTSGLIGLATDFGITVEEGETQRDPGLIGAAPGDGTPPPAAHPPAAPPLTTPPPAPPSPRPAPAPVSGSTLGSGQGQPPLAPLPPQPSQLPQPSSGGGYGYPPPQPAAAGTAPPQGGYGYPPPQQPAPPSPGGYGYPPPHPTGSTPPQQLGGYGYPPPAQPPQPPQPPMPQQHPGGDYGYPPSQGGYGYPPPQGGPSGYGYPPQAPPAPTASPPAQHGYGYPPQPVHPPGQPQHQHPAPRDGSPSPDARGFTLPPQGPQFQPDRSGQR